MHVKWNGPPTACFKSMNKASVQIGWQGEWGCNTCARTILHEDPEINGAVAAADSANFCPADGQRTLIVDLAHGSRNWVCLPGCTLPTCMERVCPDENIPDQRHDHALLMSALSGLGVVSQVQESLCSL